MWGSRNTQNAEIAHDVIADGAGKNWLFRFVRLAGSDGTPVEPISAAQIGATNEAAATTDTATSGLNGRLQRIAQRLASLIALLPASLGAKAPSASLSITPAGLEYEIVIAGQTAQPMGAVGATGDYLSHVIFYPATTGAGTSYILDGAIEVAKITTGTLSDLRPITIPVNAFSVSGPWKVTTGANMTATAFGDFT